MLYKKSFFVFILATTVLTGCKETPSQNIYDFRDTGQSIIVEFGTVIDARQITIKGPNSGTGAIAGAIAGGLSGAQISSNDTAITVGGMIVGVITGTITEQAIADRVGLDFTIVLQSGNVITVSQYIKKDEPLIKKGQRVIVQTSGSYKRVLPADHLPEQLNRPKGIKLID